MIHDVPKPEISDAFTIEDIHKLRYWNYERMKDATIEERIDDTNRRASHFLRQVESGRSAAKPH